ncbi:hypothetical protein LOTGIDRAFT_122147 [Lottia gigantea]|uniref:Uncharacterized protein n=1 Tax=Lottia gigantea TaxID=225164 RepID=V3ZK79_LOTGI|nr:hypothetical protein LOTGIDRAFT_122147 [Lottia gigantea]ESO91713.1 hypothetical protein LOTGIDRAFT_122147 [Lottia gigantea]
MSTIYIVIISLYSILLLSSIVHKHVNNLHGHHQFIWYTTPEFNCTQTCQQFTWSSSVYIVYYS